MYLLIHVQQAREANFCSDEYGNYKQKQHIHVCQEENNLLSWKLKMTLRSIGEQTVERQDSKHPSEREGYTTESSCGRYNGTNSWYFNLLAGHCFSFCKAAVSVRYIDSKFPFQTTITFRKEIYCFSIFQITLQVFPPFSSLWNILWKRGGFTLVGFFFFLFSIDKKVFI